MFVCFFSMRAGFLSVQEIKNRQYLLKITGAIAKSTEPI